MATMAGLISVKNFNAFCSPQPIWINEISKRFTFFTKKCSKIYRWKVKIMFYPQLGIIPGFFGNLGFFSEQVLLMAPTAAAEGGGEEAAEEEEETR